tara:strand:+ start:4941 stop:5111 length:171 start_codon:yes stop_codon:yes gene_type:complete
VRWCVVSVTAKSTLIWVKPGQRAKVLVGAAVSGEAKGSEYLNAMVIYARYAPLLDV